MADKPVIFISASSDLRSARDLVGRVLYSMGYEPVWQEIAATEGGELLDVLRQRIRPCAMVVQLAGRRYGAEPPRATAEFGRVSYTQFEALEAERLGKKVVYHFLDDSFPVDPTNAEPPELAALQERYRQQLIDANKLRYDRIADPNQLELSIRRVRDELAELRRQGDRRHRNLLWMASSAVVGIVIVAVATFVALQRQAKEAEDLAAFRAEMANYRADVKAAVSPKQLSAGQKQPDPFTQKILAEGQKLIDRGNAEDRALGLITHQQHADADHIIQQLKSKPDNPIDEAFKLLTMEGDNWYQANDCDRAIGPYTKAEALRPNDIKARNNLALALIYAHHGDVAANTRRAIEITKETLGLTTLFSADWARTQMKLGAAWANLPDGNKTENLHKAIECYQEAAMVFTRASHPVEWATIQNNLGSAWSEFPTGDDTANLKQAIALYDQALAVRTKEARPDSWAQTENNLGVAWEDFPIGDETENVHRAIAAYEAALTVRTKENSAIDWAQTQSNLGYAYSILHTGRADTNLKLAIDHFEQALTVFNKENCPAGWGWTQDHLGYVWTQLSTGSKAENVQRAIAAFQDALSVRTKTVFPADWAHTQSNLGYAMSILPGNKADNLKKAIDLYQQALTVFTKDRYPRDWARTQDRIAAAWSVIPAGDKTQNLQKSIATYELALTVYQLASDPANWARTQYSLAIAWKNLPSGDKTANLRHAISAFEAAIVAYRANADQTGLARAELNLGNAWSALPTGDRTLNLKNAIAPLQSAIAIYDKRGYSTARRDTATALAWAQLLTKDFAGALNTADREPRTWLYLSVETRRAHALLFLGRSDEARAIYLNHVGESIPGSWLPWEQTIFNEFDELQRAGLSNPEFAALRVAVAVQAVISDNRKNRRLFALVPKPKPSSKSKSK